MPCGSLLTKLVMPNWKPLNYIIGNFSLQLLALILNLYNITSEVVPKESMKDIKDDIDSLLATSTQKVKWERKALKKIFCFSFLLETVQ